MLNGFWRLMFLVCIVSSLVAGMVYHNEQNQLYLFAASVLFYLFVIESHITRLHKKLPQTLSTEIKLDQAVFSQLFVNAITKVAEAVIEMQKNAKAKKTTPRGKN